MKLFEHPEFPEAIKAVRSYFNHPGLTEQFIEKDYYITESLRIVASQWPDTVIFKGGTSLSKGWKLIERFSEDIDLFLNKNAFTPPAGENKITNELKAIRDAVQKHPGLTLLSNGTNTKGVSRTSYYDYRQYFSGLGSVKSRILLEMGTRSGSYPITSVRLSSYISDFLTETKNSLEAEDELPFSMNLLHFKRTFVEKLFAIHSKVMRFKDTGKSIGTYARHYYDLFQLAKEPDVREMIEDESYQKIKEDCASISRTHFPHQSDPPIDLMFSSSPALFPTQDIRNNIAKEYQQQCQTLCYGSFPSWEEVEACFEEIREKL